MGQNPPIFEMPPLIVLYNIPSSSLLAVLTVCLSLFPATVETKYINIDKYPIAKTVVLP
jgi:hypothetical protein